MSLVVLLLVFAGVTLVLANELVAARQRPPVIEYRYLPRDLDTYVREQPLASVTFQSMFADENVQYPREALKGSVTPAPPKKA